MHDGLWLQHFVVTRVDYCNAVLYKSAVAYRWTWNAAACLVIDGGKVDGIAPVFRDVFHFKVPSAAFDCVRDTGSAYFEEDSCTPCRSHLRSVVRGDTFVPRTTTEFGW